MPASQPQTRNDFHVALFCALETEANAIHAAFDLFWEDDYGQAVGDKNTYSTGVLGGHNVVLVYLPGTGKVSAATVAASLRSSFPNIELALVVGVCGAAPSSTHNNEIFLGDLIISTSIVQYDFGRQHDASFETKDTLEDVLGRPDTRIRGFIAKLRTQHYRSLLQTGMRTSFKAICDSERATKYPGRSRDVLFRSDYLHIHKNERCKICDRKAGRSCRLAPNLSCDQLGCERTQLVSRKTVPHPVESLLHQPQVHFGKIGSSDTVLRSATHRDKLAEKDGIIAFEMEGAGVWEHFPSIIVKSTCDYSDSHKNKEWQSYAAAVAAAGAKALLDNWRSEMRLASDRRPWEVATDKHSSGIRSNPGQFTALVGNLMGVAVEGDNLIESVLVRYSYIRETVFSIFKVELTSYKWLFGGVRTLCRQLHETHGSSGLRLRVVALHVQLEDCVKELTQWTDDCDIAVEQHASLQHRTQVSSWKDDVEIAVARKFRYLVRRKLEIPMKANTTSICQTLKQYFDQRRTDIRTALSVLWSEVNQPLMEPFDMARRHDETMTERTESAALGYIQSELNLPNESRSKNSRPVISISYSDRLREVHEMYSELSQSIRALSETLSSATSINSHHSVSQDHTKRRAGRSLSGSETGESISDVDNSEDGDQEDELFDLITGTYRGLDVMAQHYFDSVVVDYFRAVQQWQLIRSRTELQKLKRDDIRAMFELTDFGPYQIPHTAARLLSLRERATAEGFKDNIDEADQVLAFSESYLAECMQLAAQRLDSKRLELPDGQVSDLRAAVNEWLLKELFANDYLFEYHTAIVDDVMRSDSRFSVLANENAWDRIILKSWFLDDTVQPEMTKYKSTHGTVDSKLDVNIEDEDEGSVHGWQRSPSNPELENDEAVVRQLFPNITVCPSHDQIVVDRPPEGPSLSQKALATRVLDAYRAEPSRNASTGEVTEPSGIKQFSKRISTLRVEPYSGKIGLMPVATTVQTSNILALGTRSTREEIGESSRQFARVRKDMPWLNTNAHLDRTKIADDQSTLVTAIQTAPSRRILPVKGNAPRSPFLSALPVMRRLPRNE